MLEQLTDKARLLLLAQLPAIRKHVTEQMPAFLKTYGLKGAQYATDSERLAPLFQTVYQSLPMPVRVVVKQETFVRFCLSQKESLLGKRLEAPEETAPPAKSGLAATKPKAARQGAAAAKVPGKEKAKGTTPVKQARTKEKPVQK